MKYGFFMHSYYYRYVTATVFKAGIVFIIVYAGGSVPDYGQPSACKNVIEEL